MSKPLSSGMGESKKSENLEDVVKAGVTAVVVLVATWFDLDVSNNAITQAIVSFFAAVIVFGLYCLVNKVVDEYNRKRYFGKYEGYWLQLIPDHIQRPFTILKLEFDKGEKKYHLQGWNYYGNDTSRFVDFRAYRTIERGNGPGFYYIVDNIHNTYPNEKPRNGLGKLCITHTDEEGLTWANGYFYDVTDDPVAYKRITTMVKCDTAFYEFTTGIVTDSEAMMKKEHNEIMDSCKDFAQKELDKLRSGSTVYV